jgi:hypothetical protein
MPGIVDSIIEAYGGDEIDSEFLAASREKVSRYIETLSLMGETDRRQLAAYGRAYLDELRNPDRRYTGC